MYKTKQHLLNIFTPLSFITVGFSFFISDDHCCKFILVFTCSDKIPHVPSWLHPLLSFITYVSPLVQYLAKLNNQNVDVAVKLTKWVPTVKQTETENWPAADCPLCVSLSLKNVMVTRCKETLTVELVQNLYKLISYLPKRETSTPTMREPSRPPIAKTDTMREYKRVRVSPLSPAPFRLNTVLL